MSLEEAQQLCKLPSEEEGWEQCESVSVQSHLCCQFADGAFFPMACFAMIIGANWLDLPCCSVFMTVPSAGMQEIGFANNTHCFPFPFSILLQISSRPWAHSSAVPSNTHSTIAMSSDIPKACILPKLNRTPTWWGFNLKSSLIYFYFD